MLFKKFKTPSEMYLAAMGFLRSVCRKCGVDLFDENHRITWRTNCLLYGGIAYFIFIFYTIYANIDENWTILLRSAVTLGSGVQGLFKLIDFLLKRKDIANLYNLIIRLYKENEILGAGYRKALDDAADKTKKGIFLLFILYGFAALGMLALPYCLYLFTGEHHLIIEFHIPGLDINTDFGYFCTLGIQTYLIILFTSSLFCGDAGAMMFLTQVYVFSNLFEAKIECINELIENPENNKHPEINNALNDIIEWHQLYLRYTKSVNRIFYVVISMQIFTGFTSTLFCIYLILAGGWPGAYSYTVLAFSSFYLYCVMGTQNEIANDNICLHMYKFNWYNLTVPHQKMTRQIIMKTQSPETIDIAGVMPLTVSTALQLTKTLYSIAMFMLEFLVH